MSLKINQKVTVLAVFYGQKLPIKPIKLMWGNKQYSLGKVDFYHTTRDGHHKVHHFSMTDTRKSMYLKLAFHSGNLSWTLEETEPCQ